MKFQIAIDGPSGVGKSSVAFKLAQRLNFLYVNTGLLFRGFAFLLQQKRQKNPNLLVVDLIQELKNNAFLQYKQNQIFYQDQDVTPFLKTPIISKLTSDLAQNSDVRNYILTWEKEIIKNHNIVMEGRDIGSIVLPNAFLKIFLTATPKTRAMRRFQELKKLNILNNETLETIEFKIKDRDYQDQNRKIAPLVKAANAYEINTDDMNIELVVLKIEQLFLEKLKKIED